MTPPPDPNVEIGIIGKSLLCRLLSNANFQVWEIWAECMLDS